MRKLLTIFFVCLSLVGLAGEMEEFAKQLKLAEQGNAFAQYNIGLMYYKGMGVPKDDKEAVKWWRKAAEQGNANAQTNLGFMYYKGEGVPKDGKEAFKWRMKAAEQGCAKAQYEVGSMYCGSESVPQDYKESEKWYRKAAEQGDAEAQLQLGHKYSHSAYSIFDPDPFLKKILEGGGRNIYTYNQDYKEAVKWYRKAAEQGNAIGQYCLGGMYFNPIVKCMENIRAKDVV